MARKPPYFKFYPKDFAADAEVEAMSTLGVGAYILLLCKSWHEDPPGSLPADHQKLARWSRLSPDAWSEVKQEVLAAFRLGADGRYHQSRMRREYDDFLNKSKKAAKSATQRWGNTAGKPNAVRSHSRRTLRASESESESGASRNPNPKSKRAKSSSVSSVSSSRARADFSDSDFGEMERLKGLRRYEAALVDVVAPAGTKQHESDRTSIGIWFHESIWPPGLDPAVGKKRMVIVSKLVSGCKRKATPMAWLTTRVKKEFAS